MNAHEHASGRRSEDLRFILRGNKRGLAILCVFALIVAFSEAYLLGAIVQSVAALAGGRTSVDIEIGPVSWSTAVPVLLGAALGAALVRGALVALISYTGPRITAGSRQRHRDRLFATYLNADWSTQAADKTGRMVQTLSTSVNEANTVISLATQAVPALLTLVVLLTVALVLNPLVTGVIVLLGLAIASALRPTSRRARRAARADAQARNATASHVSGVLAAGAEITVFGSREGVIEIGEERIGGAEQSYARAAGLKRLVATAGQSIAFSVAAGGLLVLSVSGADIDFATVGTITVLLLRGAGLAQQVQTATSQYGTVAPFIEQVRTLIEFYDGRRARFGAQPFPERCDITLDRVSYVYPGTTRSAVDVEHATFAEGRPTAILGPSGSGKSTLIQLILRLRAATEGEVRFGGVLAESIDEVEFSSKVSYVPQAPHLVPGTIAENIRFFRPHISDADVIRAAQLAHVHDDIERMQHGYDTVLDAHVDGLSGGQKQRLAIARALTSSPSMLVLDEPTSALDATSEAAVLDTLDRLAGSITVIMITHKESTAARCDRVLLLADGRLTERGREAAGGGEPRAPGTEG